MQNLFGVAMSLAYAAAQSGDSIPDLDWIGNGSSSGLELLTSDDFVNSYEYFGDCLGLSPVIFGKEGDYVQSDMQYVQQVRDDIREYSDHDKTGRLDEELAMNLMTRFFVHEDIQGDTLVNRSLIAAEIHLEESLYFQDLKAKMDDPESGFYEEEFDRMSPQQHGHVFKNMYDADD